MAAAPRSQRGDTLGKTGLGWCCMSSMAFWKAEGLAGVLARVGFDLDIKDELRMSLLSLWYLVADSPITIRGYVSDEGS